MKSLGNSKLQRLNEILKGSNGIVYLMFVGRDTYAARIQGSLVETGKLFKNNSNVNQALKRLLKYGEEFLVFKRKYRENGKRGRKAEIYTASLDPIFATLRTFNIDFDEKEFQHIFKCLSAGNDFFPQYLTNIFDTSILQTSAWHITLANYFTFIVDLLRTSSLPSIDSQIDTWPHINLQTTCIPKDNVNSLLSRNPDLANRFSSIAVEMTLPQMRLNPKFKTFLSNTMQKIDTLQPDLQESLKFLLRLKQLDESARAMGLANIYELPLEMEKIVSQMENMRARAEKMKKQLENIEREIKEGKII